MKSNVLTALQGKVLSSLFANGLGERGFYLTGGTALAEFYLQHRLSDDLDLFTRSAEALGIHFEHAIRVLKSIRLVFAEQRMETDYAKFIVFDEAEETNKLKVEFARDRAGNVMMVSPKNVDGIMIDSFEDIAVNKVCTILSRGPYEPKDFVDLYFILNESEFTLDYLLGRAREKEASFDTEEGVLAFATNLLGAKDLKMLPRLVKPVSLSTLENYFTPVAENLIQRLRPGK